MTTQKQFEMDENRFYEFQLNDKTSVVGIQDKDEIIMLMEEYHKYRVQNCNTPAVGVAKCELVQSLHKDLKGFQDEEFLTPDTKRGIGIAIEQVERYMRGELEARQ